MGSKKTKRNHRFSAQISKNDFPGNPDEIGTCTTCNNWSPVTVIPGAIVTTVESVLFELCEACDSPRFKKLLELIKGNP